MKTLIRNLGIIGAVILGLSLTACQNSSNQGTPRRGRAPVTQGIVSPTTGQLNTSMPWGAITTGGNFSSSTISILTGGASGIGSVSGNANDPSGTGILFRGQVDQNSGTGKIGIGIWDSVAAQTGNAIYFEMPVVLVQPNNGGNGAQVTIRQGSTTFVFDGVFSGNLWNGTVYSQDADSGENTTLGNFTIQSCGIFSC